MRRFLFRHGVPASALVLGIACSTGSPPSTGDDTPGVGGTSGGASAVGGAGTGAGTAGAGTAGQVSAGGSAGTGAAAGGTGGTGGTGGSTGGAAGALATTGGAGGAGGGAGMTPAGGQGGSAGTGGASGSAGDASGGMPMGGSAGDATASGGMGAAGAAGTTSAYPGTVILQDDFDSAGALDAKWFAYPDYDATQQPKIDTTRVHSAPNAIKVSSSSSGSFIMNPKSMDLPAAGNKFYARVWVNFEKATNTINGHAAYLVGAVAQDNSGTELRLGMSSPGSSDMMDLNLQNPSDGGGGEVTRFSNGFTTGGNPGDFPGAGYSFDANKWYCLEALFDGAGSEFRVWVDSTEIMEMHVHDFTGNSTPRVMWGPTFNYLKIGGQNFSGAIGTVWYDDVFVGSDPVGCTR